MLLLRTNTSKCLHTYQTSRTNPREATSAKNQSLMGGQLSTNINTNLLIQPCLKYERVKFWVDLAKYNHRAGRIRGQD